MAATPPSRPWYRSPALWFLVPGVVFLVWGWVFSMQHQTNLDFEIWGYSGRLQNDGSTMGANWMERPAPGLAPTPPKELHFEVIPRPYWASTDWLPLPSYLVTAGYPKPWHYLDIPYWLLLLVYLGLWQLPWLARYHRRRRIDRAQAIDPVEPMKTPTVHLLIEKPGRLCYLSRDQTTQAMRPTRSIPFSSVARAALVVLAFGLSQASAQQPAPNPPNPPPQVGLSAEPDLKNQPPSLKFTNTTGNELSVAYGPEAFKLKPGASNSVPIPKAQMTELRIDALVGKERRRLYVNSIPQNPPKWFIPLKLEKPKKEKQPALPK